LTRADLPIGWQYREKDGRRESTPPRWEKRMTIAVSEAKTAGHLSRSAWSWAMFEWARNPYVILVTIYVFAPYVATVLFSNPVEGQVFVAGANKTSGIIVALTVPFLGAAMDAMGRRKPAIALIAGVMSVLMCLLWFAAPGGQGMGLTQLFIVIMVIGILFNWSEALHNAMLPAAAGDKIAETSGAGLALGNAASVLLLFVILVWFALPGKVDLPLVPDAPAFGLDTSRNEAERLVGPVVGIWLALFTLPLLFYVPDGEGTGVKFAAAARQSIGAVWTTVRGLRETPSLLTFLIARMIYADGKTALLIFGGVYAAGVMKWGLAEMAAQGIWLSLWATLGGFAAGPMDRLFGPKRSVIIALIGSLFSLTMMLSVTPTSILYGVEVGDKAVWASPLFASLPELFYLGVTSIIAVFVTSCYASSRTLLIAIAPPEKLGAIFGLYALSGTATVWLGPLLVEYFTKLFQSQKAGMAGVAILLVLGLAILAFVKMPETDRPADQSG
jgi:MFS transporter, UMF1 family